MKIAITGSEGLIGTRLKAQLAACGHEVVGFDLRCAVTEGTRGDVRDADAVRRVVATCEGVVHLAAVSRVVWGERDPVLCHDTNVGGTRNVVAAAHETRHRPFLILASSREVYGEPDSTPVAEDAPRNPINIYGRSKAAAEDLVLAAQGDGLRAAVLRLSNVYGSTADHADRVVPAFARAAAFGGELRLDGAEHTFDFTHVDDAVRGIVAAINALVAGERSLPPIHLVTGRPTTLGRLAEMAVRAGGGRARIRVAPPRNYDVARFVGDPTRATHLLGWRASRSLEDGVRDLVAAYTQETTPSVAAGVRP